jgi:hypothetical protein
MVGAIPKFMKAERASRAISPAAPRRALLFSLPFHLPLRWRWIALAALCVALTVVLAQFGKAPNAGMLAANTDGAKSRAARSHTSIEAFDDRFPRLQFSDRFPAADESMPQVQREVALAPQAPRMVRTEPVRVASITPTLNLPRTTEREELTTLVSMKSSAFPYFGTNPRSEEPFLNISKGDRKGHRSYGGRVYWQDETYNDSRVLVHVPETFDAKKPGVIVVFFHGNGATLERVVRDRLLVPQLFSDSGSKAVLLAPQMAVIAGDCCAGMFWQPGGF